MNFKEMRAAIEAAQNNFEVEGELEIDDAPDDDKELETVVSVVEDWRKNTGGMYVKAWVWVTEEQIDKELK